MVPFFLFYIFNIIDSQYNKKPIFGNKKIDYYNTSSHKFILPLFDKRYKAYDTLMFLTSAVSKMADGTVNEMKKAYLDTIIETYKSISMVGVETLNCKEYSNMYVSLIFEAGKSVNIFNLKKDENKKITTFLIAVHEYVLSVYANKITNDTELKTAYNQLVELHLEEKMEKQIKIK